MTALVKGMTEASELAEPMIVKSDQNWDSKVDAEFLQCIKKG